MTARPNLAHRYRARRTTWPPRRRDCDAGSDDLLPGRRSGSPALADRRARCSRSRPSCSGSRRSSRRGRWCSTTACSRRRRWRCATASSPFRDIFSSQGPVFLPLRLGRRPRRLAHARRPAPARRRRRACCSRSRSTRARADVTSRGNALLAAGLVTTSGSVLWVTGAGERRRPVARAVGARGRVRAARTATNPRLRTAVWVGLAAGGGGVDQGAVGAGAGDRRAVVLLSNAELRRGVRDAALAAGDRGGACTWWPRCRSGSPTCGTSRSRTTTTPARSRRHGGAFRKLLDTLWDRDKLVRGRARARR